MEISFWVGVRQSSKEFRIENDDESITIWPQNQLPKIQAGAKILTTLPKLKHWQLSAENIFDWLKL